MKYLKKFNEYYTSPSDNSFLAGNTTSFGSSSNMGGIASSSAAGISGKKAMPAGKDTFGPHIENYEKVLKTLKGEAKHKFKNRKRKKRKKRKNIFNKNKKS
jgi:hypothetical protein